MVTTLLAAARGPVAFEACDMWHTKKAHRVLHEDTVMPGRAGDSCLVALGTIDAWEAVVQDMVQPSAL